MGNNNKQTMQALWDSAMLEGENALWLESLYESYLQNPNLVDVQWRDFFATLPGAGDGHVKDIPHSVVQQQFREITQSSIYRPCPSANSNVDLGHERKQVKVLQLINAYRFRGHQWANIDPLQRQQKPDIEELTLEYHQLSEDDMDTVFETGSLCGPEQATLREIYRSLQQTYCSSIGAEYMHITETEEKRWLQQRLETVRGQADLSEQQKLTILHRLSDAEGLERYLHTKYVGQKRFSLEGAESLIPILDEITQRAGRHDMKEVVIGMAHRGRLNVLVNIMGKQPSDLFSEFEGTKSYGDQMGDVKYHMGFSSNVKTQKGIVHLALAFNPSHLEIVAPVVEGAVRARQYRRNDRAGNEVLPVQVHGDAAFAGQGVVMETLQMSQSRGYSTRGTLHIVVNNQIGFTTSNIQDSRTALYCTDVAKMVSAPIFHVNGDDPEAVILVTQIALDYRMAFKKDVVIDLVCYRRHGHNEADEPSATQPMMYKKIKSLLSTRSLYAQKLMQQKIISAEQLESMMQKYRQKLDEGRSVVPHLVEADDVKNKYPVNWTPYENTPMSVQTNTAVSLDIIRELSAKLEQRPDGFELHPRVEKIMLDRHKMSAGALAIDWGYAETMAYATLVNDQHAVRLSGQDSGRGTFFHRHAVLHNQHNGDTYIPLRHLCDHYANFLVIDSLLSEEAVLAFEYGFATAEPETLVIWEAQFGDFANGAQVVIDQFIVAGEQKWNRLCGLVMFLPHGFEGQGAEHSSARLERYLQLCAQNNIQVCVPSTPAQIFHLLRRQILRPVRKPLIVMTPKSLLRHKLAVSSLDELSNGGFNKVIDEIDELDTEQVERIVMCSGKVYYDILQKRRDKNIHNIALIRIEELYPFPDTELNSALQRYPNIKELIWCQEEPKNQGAWDYFEPRMAAKLKHDCHVQYIGREPSAAPAVGSAKVHAQQQRDLVAAALKL